jgi:O-antigen biosynthesis protein WbqP
MISRLLGVLLLIIISPLLLVIAAMIYIDDGRPIFFTQLRVGANNLPFRLFKFRTMKMGVPDVPSHLVNSTELLFTKTGPHLRKMSVDELPQLINIIRGEMVFIGPRPALHNQADLVKLRNQAGVHKLIPGVSGWAQINGRDELSIPEKVRFDTYYLKNKSFLLDLKILLLTIIKVFKTQGISH